jgi:hypothetical protein
MTTTQQPTASPAQALIVLGVMAYCTTRGICTGTALNAGASFHTLLDLAKSRGFTERRQFIGAMRRGKATAGAIDRAEKVCALLTADEMTREFARTTLWERFMGRGA